MALIYSVMQTVQNVWNGLKLKTASRFSITGSKMSVCHIHFFTYCFNKMTEAFYSHIYSEIL